MNVGRGLFLVSVLVLLMGFPACTRARPIPGELPRGLEGWKQQCGLLWVLTPRKDDRIRIRITSKEGGQVDYGTGFLVDEHRLASSFCRTDLPVVAAFHCLLDAEGGAPFSGHLEAWFQGRLLQAWTIPDTLYFEAGVVLPH